MQLKRNKEMEFETLKKSHKKQIVIGALAICVIGGALTFNLTRAKYKVDKSIDLAKGTVNYKPYDFKIMAMYKSEDGTNYTEITDRMPSNGYVINESKSYCTLDNKNKDTNARLYTYQEKHVFENLAKSDKCYLYFDREKSGASQILSNNIINEEIPDFSQVATSDEGVYAVSDGMYGGTSYYWRGAATNNYVQFADFCWRIVRINGDKSIRLIYDGTTCHENGTSTIESISTMQKYNLSYDRSEYVGWAYTYGNQKGKSSSSNAKKQTESWFTSNVVDPNVEKVADGKFCNDRDADLGYTWDSKPSNTFRYAGYGRANTTQITPTLSCPISDIYTLKVGALAMDEVIMVGGKWNTTNNNYYLYNGQNYYTMSPYEYDPSSAYPAKVFRVVSDGSLSWVDVDSNNSGLRPVINLRSDITFNGGDGTQSNPYVVQ